MAQHEKEFTDRERHNALQAITDHMGRSVDGITGGMAEEETSNRRLLLRHA